MHLKTVIALLGIISGVFIAEKSAYGSEVIIMSLLLGLLQISIFIIEKYFRAKGFFVELRQKDYTQEHAHSHEHSLRDSQKIITQLFSIPLVSGIFFICCALGIVRVQFIKEKELFVCVKSCTFEARLINSPTISNEFQIFRVAPLLHNNTQNKLYDVQVKVPLYPRFEVGDEVTLKGVVTPPKVSMPHDGEKFFDYAYYLRTHNVGSEMFYPSVVKITSRESQKSALVKLHHLKDVFVQTVGMNMNEPASSLASGMLFGASSLSSELMQTFRSAGISHIVVLSGFNIAILISFILFVGVRMPLFVRICIAGIFVVLFVLMVGGEASIIRATIMSFIGLLALSFGRAYTARQALLLSLILITLYEPLHLLHDVSLHLSFLATAGIVYMSDVVKKLLYKVRSESYREIIATSLCAYIATLPYVMYIFGTVSIYALLTNIIVLPFVPLEMLLTLCIIIVSPVSLVLASFFGYIATCIGDGIIFVARTVEDLPLSSFKISFSYTDMMLTYALLIFLYLWSKHFSVVFVKNETSLTKNEKNLSEVISY